MDLQFVMDGFAASKYILGYVLKSDTEVRSVAAFERHLASLQSSTSADAHAVYKAAHMALQGRITSVQEACHLTLGLPTVLISRGNEWVQVGDEATWVQIVPRHGEVDALENPDLLRNGTAPMPFAYRQYSSRPSSGEMALPVEGSAVPVQVRWVDMSFFDFVAGLDSTANPEAPNQRQRTRTRKRPAIVGHRTVHPDKEPQAFFYQKMVLYCPWRVLGDWLEPKDEGLHRNAFERLLSSNDRFLRSTCFPSMDLRMTAARELARLQASLVVQCALEGNTAQAELEGHLRLSHALRAHRPEGATELDHDAEYETTVSESLFAEIPGGELAATTLAADSGSASSVFVSWAVGELVAQRTPFVILHGPGGCGKSFAVRALVHYLRMARLGVAVAAPTGCAAHQIHGGTLHSMLALPVTNDSYGRASDAPPPSGALLQNLIEYWRDAKALVIDEVSMVSSKMLSIIDQRLQHVRARPGVPFGGLAVFLVGDFYQLPPPVGNPAYAATHLWKLFHIIELTGNHRASEDPLFADLLSRARLGVCTPADIVLLKSRIRCAPEGWQQALDEGAARLLPTRAKVAKANDIALRQWTSRHGSTSVQCPAEDVYVDSKLPSPPENAFDEAENTGGLPAYLEFCKGARVMLRFNIDIVDGLVNGACGIVDSIDIDKHQRVDAVWINFDSAGSRWLAVNGGTSVRIIPRVGNFLGKDGRLVQRRQLPIVLAWAKTIHKSQGATEKKGIVVTLDAQARRPSMAYVALSRCKRLCDVYITSLVSDVLQCPPGVERAILQLLIHQSSIASSSTTTWRRLFDPRRTMEDLEEAYNNASLGTWEERANAEDAAVAAIQSGELGQFTCSFCSEAFYTQLALDRHTRKCESRPRQRRRGHGRGRHGSSGG